MTAVATVISSLVAAQIERIRRGDPPSHLSPTDAAAWSKGRAARLRSARKPRWQTAAWKLGFDDARI